MLLTYRPLLKTPSGLEYLLLAQGTMLSVQGEGAAAGRVRQAYASAAFMQRADPDSAFAPLSLSQKGGLCSALFSGQGGGLLREFLKRAPPAAQYAAGRRAGRALRALHSLPLEEAELKLAEKHQAGFMEKLASYLGSMPHFRRDQVSLDALSERYDHFKCWKTVRRYGQLRDDRILVRADSTVALLPSASCAPGDACEDFALLECQCAGLYPLCCAGIIDGYFQGAIPPAFWVSFALQSAFYSLWRLGRMAQSSRRAFVIMQSEHERVCADFEDFKKPVPSWYRAESVKKARQAANAKGL